MTRERKDQRVGRKLRAAGSNIPSVATESSEDVVRRICRGGRPLELTEEVLETICSKIVQSNYVRESVLAAGVSVPAYYHWLKVGRIDIEANRETIHARFALAVTRASAEAEVRHIQNLHALATGAQSESVRMAATIAIIERKSAERWGRRLRVDGITPETAAKMPDEELDRELAERGIEAEPEDAND